MEQMEDTERFLVAPTSRGRPPRRAWGNWIIIQLVKIYSFYAAPCGEGALPRSMTGVGFEGDRPQASLTKVQ
jgi:hypothetical protein